MRSISVTSVPRRLSGRQDGGAVAQLSFADRREEQVSPGDGRSPTPRRRDSAPCESVLTPNWCLTLTAHSTSPPQSKAGGSRPESLGGNSRFTPLSGPKCERMMLARFRESRLASDDIAQAQLGRLLHEASVDPAAHEIYVCMLVWAVTTVTIPKVSRQANQIVYR